MADNKNYGLNISAESLSNEMNDMVAKTGKDLRINVGNPVASPTSQTFMSGFSSDAFSKDPVDGLEQGIVEGVHNLNIPGLTPSSQPFTTGFSSETSNDIQDTVESTGMHFGNIAVPPAARPDSDGHFGSSVASGFGLSAENYTQNAHDIQDRFTSVVPTGLVDKFSLPSTSDALDGSNTSAEGMKFDIPDSLTSTSAGSFLNEKLEESQTLATNTFDDVAVATTSAQNDLFSNVSEATTTAEESLFNDVAEASTTAENAHNVLFNNVSEASETAEQSLFGYTGGSLSQEVVDKDAEENEEEAIDDCEGNALKVEDDLDKDENDNEEYAADEGVIEFEEEAMEGAEADDLAVKDSELDAEATDDLAAKDSEWDAEESEGFEEEEPTKAPADNQEVEVSEGAEDYAEESKEVQEEIESGDVEEEATGGEFTVQRCFEFYTR
jgi:hypothetical protein